MRGKKAATPPNFDLIRLLSEMHSYPPGPVPIERIRELLLSLDHAEKLSELLHSEDTGIRIQEALTIEGLGSVQEVLNKRPANALTLVKLVCLERGRKAGKLEEDVKKMILEEKKKRFAPVREKGMEKKIENAQQLRVDILTINADLLKRPASEGWGIKKKRADHISKKTGKSFSYISKIIATPRKTNQT